MKRILSVILVVALLLTLSACGSVTEDKEAKEQSKTQTVKYTLDDAKKLLKEHKYEEAYAAFKSLKDPEAKIYLKGFVENACEKITEYNSDGTIYTIQTYNTLTYFDDGEVFVKREVKFDENGSAVVIKQSISEGLDDIILAGKGIYPSHTLANVFEYDEYGNITKIAQKLIDGTICNESYYKNNYDKDGNLVSIEYCDKDGNLTGTKTVLDKYGRVTEFVNVYNDYGRTEYKYDDNGNKIQAIRYNKYDEIISDVGYVYDENSNLLSVTIDGKIDREYENGVLKKSYVYDEEGNITGERFFDEHGHLYLYILSGSYDPLGFEHKNEYKNEYEYDKNGNLTVYRRNSALAQRTITYKYDENNNLVSKTQFDGDNNETLKEEYKYDKNGRMTKKMFYEKKVLKGEIEYITPSVIYDPATAHGTDGTLAWYRYMATNPKFDYWINEN